MSLDEAVAEYKAAIEARLTKHTAKLQKDDAASEAQRVAEEAGFEYEASKAEVLNAKALLVQAADDLAAEL